MISGDLTDELFELKKRLFNVLDNLEFVDLDNLKSDEIFEYDYLLMQVNKDYGDLLYLIRKHENNERIVEEMTMEVNGVIKRYKAFFKHIRQ